jgi:hypothetical protein
MASFPESNAQHEEPISWLKRLVRAVHRQRALFAGTFSPRCTPVLENDVHTGPASLEEEKRRHRRIGLTKTSVNVTDGCLCATALLANISPSGLCLCNLPEQLYRSASRLTIFSSDNPGLPVLHIEPRWEQTGWNGKTIGAVIINAPRAWGHFFLRTANRHEH